jgi:hypothetical protein
VRESDIERFLDKLVVKYGGHTRKLSYIGRRGAPDRMVLLNGVHFAELKTPSGILSPHQEFEISLLNRQGANTSVLRTKDDVLKWITALTR